MALAKPREDRTALGLGLMALAVIGFTCIDSSAKWLILAGLPALQVVYARYAGHFLIAAVIFTAQEGRAAFQSNAPKRQLARSLFLMASTFLNFSALNYLPITVTTTILFAVPVVVTLLATPILGEQVGFRRILAVCVGFVGVLVVMQPWGAGFHPAMLLSLGALLMAASFFIMTRLLAGIEANSTQQIWSSGVPTLILLPLVVSDWVWPSGTDWIAFVLIGCFGAASHIASTTAHRLADASILSPVLYIQIFTAALAGVTLFGTWPTAWTLLGGAIIIGSGLYIWHRERTLRSLPSRAGP